MSVYESEAHGGVTAEDTNNEREAKSTMNNSQFDIVWLWAREYLARERKYVCNWLKRPTLTKVKQ